MYKALFIFCCSLAGLGLTAQEAPNYVQGTGKINSIEISVANPALHIINRNNRLARREQGRSLYLFTQYTHYIPTRFPELRIPIAVGMGLNLLSFEELSTERLLAKNTIGMEYEIVHRPGINVHLGGGVGAEGLLITGTNSFRYTDVEGDTLNKLMTFNDEQLFYPFYYFNVKADFRLGSQHFFAAINYMPHTVRDRAEADVFKEYRGSIDNGVYDRHLWISTRRERVTFRLGYYF